jgi:hypothetical protein
LWTAVYGELSEGRPGLLGSITARAEAQAVRLAVLYALLDGSGIIERLHLQAALAVWRYCEDSAAQVFGGRLGYPLADRLYGYLTDADDGLSRTDIRAKVGNGLPADDVDAALGYLARRGLAASIRIGTRGRPQERWRTATPGGNGENGAKPDVSSVTSVSSEAVRFDAEHRP